MQSIPSASSLLMQQGELCGYDAIFSDVELSEFLNRVQQEDELGGMAPLGLQFLPPDQHQQAPNDMGHGHIMGSNVSSYDDIPGHQVKAMSMMQAHQNAPSHHAALQQHTMTLDSLHHHHHLNIAPPPPLPSTSAFALPFPLAPAPAPRGSKVQAEQKPQVSHSTVEKQRRDRINSLIDELRELVPPSKATIAAAAAAGPNAKDGNPNSEARRPKHVVLADTIALLKQLQLRGPLSSLVSAASLPTMMNSSRPSVSGVEALMGGGSMAPPTLSPPNGPAVVKTEHVSPSNSNSKGSVSSQEDMDMNGDTKTAAPKLPNIPIQPTMLSGVVVQRGPDCMYVQVRCRDRKGLLLDIIGALKQLPLEVRTAAVTTQDGLVRDVFEVCVDDQQLQPEDIQNMVHEALFQQYAPGDPHKRPRCVA